MDDGIWSLLSDISDQVVYQIPIICINSKINRLVAGDDQYGTFAYELGRGSVNLTKVSDDRFLLSFDMIATTFEPIFDEYCIFDIFNTRCAVYVNDVLEFYLIGWDVPNISRGLDGVPILHVCFSLISGYTQTGIDGADNLTNQEGCDTNRI